MESSKKDIFGYLAEFDSASEVYEVSKKMRDLGCKKWDVHSPFPIHGLDKAMGIPRSKLPILVFIGGFIGFTTAFLLQYLTQVIIYPTVVQAKPTNIFTIPAYIPVMFEMTILFSAFTTLFGMLFFTGLPRWNHPLFNCREFDKFSDDGFFISVEKGETAVSIEEVKNLLIKNGAKKLHEVTND